MVHITYIVLRLQQQLMVTGAISAHLLPEEKYLISKMRLMSYTEICTLWSTGMSPRSVAA